MTFHNDVVLSVEGKMEKVFSIANSLKAKNLALLKQMENMENLISAKNREIEDLKSKYHHLQIVKGFTGMPGEAHEAKLRINRMVREIDKCIALLNR